MIVGEVKRTIPARDDAACASVPGARCFHRVFAIPAALSERQHLFAIAEPDSVALVGERAARPDQCDRLESFLRQLLFTDFFLGKTKA